MIQHIFIDGGGNYPQQPSVGPDAMFPRPFDCVYVFEPNPACWQAYSKSNVRLVRAAIWDCDEPRPFYLSKYPGQQGSSLLPHKLTEVGDHLEAAFLPEPITVPCIAFGPWLHTNMPADAHVTLKLDIEGAEYAVLRHLLDTGEIHHVHALFVEFHWTKIQLPESKHLELVDALRLAGHDPRPWLP
jgi:FkbM family methyltransferase